MKVIMPRIGMTMQDGKITKWYPKDGETIKEGEPLFEFETEKLTNVVDSPASGVFHKLAQEGDIILCGEDIAEIEE